MQLYKTKQQVQKNAFLDIALVICPPWDTLMPSLGLAYLASFLKSKSITLKVFDLNIDLFSESSSEHKKFWNVTYIAEWIGEKLHEKILENYSAYTEAYVDKILKENPRLICFSINIANTYFTTEVIKRIRKKNKKTIIGVGGPNSDDIEIWK